MKKGISLIVLVITIIVMIIIAGAIILSLSSSNVTGKANWATISSDRANLQSEFAVVLADIIASDADGVVSKTEFMDDDKYETWAAKVVAEGFKVNSDAADPAGFYVYYDGAAISGAPTTTPSWYQAK